MTGRDIAARLDRLPVTGLHLLALCLCGLGFAFDTFELAQGGVLAAVFSAPPHAAPPGELSLLLASVYIGATLGAPTLGWLADRHGRRGTLAALMVGLGLSSFASAASDSALALTISRGLGGLAMGAYPPIVIAFLTDLLPPARRGMLIFTASAFGTLGPPLGIFMVRWLTPLQPMGLEAWRWGFIIGGVGTLLVGLLFRFLPESPRWLQSRGKLAQAELACRAFEGSMRMLKPRPGEAAPPVPVPSDAAAAVERPSRGHQTVLAAIFLLSPWATVTFPILSGAVLTQKGFKVTDALLVLGLSWFGPLIGSLLASTSIDRVDRRAALGLFALAMTVSGALFVVGADPGWLTAASLAFGLFASLYVPTLTMYGAEMYPTAARARSVAAAWALNRVGAAVAPLLLLPLLRSAGAFTMFGVIAATLLSSVALLTLAPRGRQQLSIA